MIPNAIAEHGLPTAPEIERLVLGAVQLDDSLFPEVSAILSRDDFADERNRRVWSCMADLHERGERIDRVTVGNSLLQAGHLESVGVSYVTGLDDGLPSIAGAGRYARIVREHADRRRLIYAAQKMIDQAITGHVEASEIAAAANHDMLGFAAREESKLETVHEIVGRVNGLDGLMRGKKGIQTGFSRLDDMTGGLGAGELFVLAGRPSMGKSAIAMNIADFAAMSDQRKAVAVFSLEMPRESLVTRLLCSRARVNLGKWRAGYLSHEERRRVTMAYKSYESSRLWIDDTASMNMREIHSKARRKKAESGLDLLVIDYLQLVSGSTDAESRNVEVGQNTRYAKLMAKDLGIPVILLSQLSRAPETRPGDHRPQMSDLRDSGSIEQDADIVAFIFREEVYKPDREDLKGLAELLLSKQRNGPTGRVPLIFVKEYTKFESLSDEWVRGAGGGEKPAPEAYITQ